MSSAPTDYTVVQMLAHVMGLAQHLEQAIKMGSRPYGTDEDVSLPERLVRLRRSARHITDEYFPSGSGVDAPIEIDWVRSHVQDKRSRSEGQRIVVIVPYHHMDEHGSYSHWCHYRVEFRPQFNNEYDLCIRSTGDGSTPEDREYIGEVVMETLSSHAPRPLTDWADEIEVVAGTRL